eukprot:g28674.t1
MESSKLRSKLRKSEETFAQGSNPADFQRLARELTRRRQRPQASTADDTELNAYAVQSMKEYQTIGSPTGNLAARRFSHPVLAETRPFDEPSSLQLEAQLWRVWQSKDWAKLYERTSQMSLSRMVPRKLWAALPQRPVLPPERSLKTTSWRMRIPLSSLQEALLLDEPVLEAVRDREEVLIMLDWDDTILPTTWLTSRPWFKEWLEAQKGSVETMAADLIDPEDLDVLREIDTALQFLETILCAGKPVCITLSQRPWVEQSMKAFLPKLAELWEEWASWCLKSSGPSLLESTVMEMSFRSQQKRKVMKRLLRGFYQGQSCCHAISIGDGLAERNALQDIAWCHESLTEQCCDITLQVKTIQMLEDPMAAELKVELQVLREWLPAVEEWLNEQIRFQPSVRLVAPRLVRYRGKSFIQDFQKMLSTTGGEKPPVDPKKPNPAETAELARQCAGRAWLDLRALIPPAARQVDSSCSLEPEVKDSDLLVSSRTFTRLSLHLSYDVTPPESSDMKVRPQKLLPDRLPSLGRFGGSEDAGVMYQEVIERSCEAILQDCHGLSNVEEALKQLKEVGSYEEVKQSLRESIICIFRERLRKDGQTWGV